MNRGYHEIKEHGKREFPFNIYPCTIPLDFPAVPLHWHKEMELIYHLASNPNRVYTRDQLLDEGWGFEYYGDSRTVDVHVKRLREKLDGVSDQWTLKTVWGVGYKFEVKDKIA